MSRLYVEYEGAISELTPVKKLAFACSCAEHVLPFFERLQRSTLPRNSLNAIWNALDEGTADVLAAVEIADAVSAVIPSIGDDEDYSLEKDIAMKSAVIVLECLDLVAGKPDAALNAGNLVFDILMLVEARRSPERAYPHETFHALEHGETLPTSVQDEWQYLRKLLDNLKNATDVKLAALQAEQRMRGSRVCSQYFLD